MQTVFQSDYTSFYSHRQCTRTHLPPHPSQHLFLSDFLFSRSWCVWHWLPDHDLACTSWRLVDLSVFCLFLPVVWISFWWGAYSSAFAHFLMGCLSFSNWLVDTSSLWVMCCKHHLVLWLVFSHFFKQCLFMTSITVISPIYQVSYNIFHLLGLLFFRYHISHLKYTRCCNPHNNLIKNSYCYTHFT